MIIALFPSRTRKLFLDLAKRICKFLSSHKVIVLAKDGQAEAIHAMPLSSVHEYEIDVFISMGGDGTMLRVVNCYSHLNIALFSVLILVS